jgi:D-arabinose 1-dehydrogenase-like Zn-dependent alcohol dehydrogenase
MFCPEQIGTGARMSGGHAEYGREYLYEALQFVAKRRVKVLAETYPLAEIGRAYERVEAGRVRFRAVVTSLQIPGADSLRPQHAVEPANPRPDET